MIAVGGIQKKTPVGGENFHVLTNGTDHSNSNPVVSNA